MPTPKAERPPCPACGANTGTTYETDDSRLCCHDCQCSWSATDVEIAQATAAELRIAAERAEEQEEKDDSCGSCLGTGIGRSGDPDTSRCGDCGGSGVPKRAREDDNGY